MQRLENMNPSESTGFQETLPLELRLQALESKLGFVAANSTASMEDRIDALEKSFEKRLTTPELRVLWKESDDLFEKLSPGPALTHQQQIVAPLLYRQQEILAGKDQLTEQLQMVSQIAQYLTLKSDSDWKNEDSVTNAALLIETKAPSEEEEIRVAVLHEKLKTLQNQTDVMVSNLDNILHQYQRLVAAASEKMVLAMEERNKM